MSNGISIHGFDDILTTLDNLEFTEAEVKEVIREAGGNLALKLKRYIKENVYRHGQTLSGVKGRITTYKGNMAYRLSITNKDILYIEYGSAKVTEYIGFFSNFIEDNMDDLLKDVEGQIEKIVDRKGV